MMLPRVSALRMSTPMHIAKTETNGPPITNPKIPGTMMAMGEKIKKARALSVFIA